MKKASRLEMKIHEGRQKNVTAIICFCQVYWLLSRPQAKCYSICVHYVALFPVNYLTPTERYYSLCFVTHYHLEL